ncbi:MAG TPA: 5-deoxy-glucuronate isomerase [Gaiellaceae bacterium]|nr:5-deoxy-glucuronate isomerase [Gaiellaceae bacterium]
MSDREIATELVTAPGVAHRCAEPVGYAPVLGPANAPLHDLSVGRLRLDRRLGVYSATTDDRETLLHILVGTCTIEAEGSWGRRAFAGLGDRRDVFSGLPTSLVLPPGTAYSVVPTSRTVDLALVSTPLAEDAGAPALIRPEDVNVHAIGEGYYERSVREVLGGDGPTARLRAGETINPVGRWSSWPHHDFHADPANAPLFEEVFLYFTKPRTGWGVQRRTGLFCDLSPVDDVTVVRNGDAAVMPLGDHPLVAGVDSEVLYVWFYVSPIAKTYARWAEDIGGYA